MEIGGASAVKVCELLLPLLTSKITIKLMHDLHHDVDAIYHFGKVNMCGCLDTQLVMEHIYPDEDKGPFMGFNHMLQRMKGATHPLKAKMGRKMEEIARIQSTDVWEERPLSYIPGGSPLDYRSAYVRGDEHAPRA